MQNAADARRIKGKEAERIAYFLGTYPQLVQTFILREMDSLRRHGYELPVFAIRRARLSSVERSLLSEKREVYYARPDRLLKHLAENVKAAITHPIRYWSSFFVVLRQLKSHSLSDILRTTYHFFIGVGWAATIRRQGIRHVHGHFAGGIIALAAHLYSGVGFSITAHASADIWTRPILLYERVKRAKFVITESEYSRRFIDGHTSYKYSGKLFSIYNEVDSKEGARLGVVRPPRADGPFKILSVGSLYKMKGHAALVEACSTLRKRDIVFDCLIIGEGPEREILTELIEQEGLADAISLAGAQSLRDVYLALAATDVFVLLSQIDIDGHRDCLPTVIMEAMAFGIPVVSTWISAIPELVENGETGFLVPERDSESAADVIERLMRDPELRRSMGRKGRQRVEERFDASRIGKRRVELFERMVNQ